MRIGWRTHYDQVPSGPRRVLDMIELDLVIPCPVSRWVDLVSRPIESGTIQVTKSDPPAKCPGGIRDVIPDRPRSEYLYSVNVRVPQFSCLFRAAS